VGGPSIVDDEVVLSGRVPSSDQPTDDVGSVEQAEFLAEVDKAPCEPSSPLRLRERSLRDSAGWCT
jgi:hypothetical protein